MNARKSGSTSAGSVVGAKPQRLRGRHADRGSPVDVVEQPVADEERVGRVNRERVEGKLEDRRVGLAHADLAREDDRVETPGDAELGQLAADEPRRLRPGVRDDTEPQAAIAERVEERMRAVDERARRTPGCMLGVEEAGELVVGERAEQVAQLRPVVEPRRGVALEQRRKLLGPEARVELGRLVRRARARRARRDGRRRAARRPTETASACRSSRREPLPARWLG